MHNQLTIYQQTVKELHLQNQCNSKFLGRLEQISKLKILETKKDLQLQA